MAERFARVHGLKTRYLEEGEGPAIIMLHGASAGSSGEVFADNLAPLAAAGFRAVAPDRPGYGMTDNPAEESIPQEMSFIEWLMEEELKVERACVVAHSQSATAAARLALAQPRTVPGVVALAALLPTPPDSLPANIPDLEGEPSIENLRTLLKEHVYDESKLTPQRLERRLAMTVGKNYAAYQRRQANRKGPRGGVSEQVWNGITAHPERFLFLVGRQDGHYYFDGQWMAPARADYARSLCPALNVAVLENCGHLIQWDAPDEMVRHVAAFAKGATQPAAARA